MKFSLRITSLFAFIILFLFCLSCKFSDKKGNHTKNASPVASVMLPDKLPAHPRLFFDRDQESEVLKKAETIPLLAELITTLRSEADKKLKLPLQKYTAEGKLLHVSREEVSRI
ncbi:MAG: hypothetical protein QG611_809, partial [Bacteroidota bacterium]|nr:hypothetical protein [Bacteroidota bacterium]